MEKIEELHKYHLYSVNEKVETTYYYSSDNWYKVEAELIKNICLLCKKLYKEKYIDDILDYMLFEYDYDLNSSDTNSERAVFMVGHVYLYKKDSKHMTRKEQVHYYMDILNGKKEFYFLGEPLLEDGYRSFLLFETEKDFYKYNKKSIKDEEFFIVHKKKIITHDLVLDTCIHNTDIKLKASDLDFKK